MCREKESNETFLSLGTFATRQRACTPCTMAMAPPKPKMGVDPARSRDIMDDMVNVVRVRALPHPRAPPRAVLKCAKCKRSPALPS